MTGANARCAGRGVRVAGHFGEFLQGRLGPEGPVALVTLPCPVLGALALRGPGRFDLRRSGARMIDRAGLRRFLSSLDLPARGVFRLRLDMPAGGGAGASTAALVALARVAGAERIAPERLALACVAHEGASDPLMMAAPERLLWASRAGRVLGAMPGLPAMEILGGFFGPGQRTSAADARFPDIGDLVEGWRGAAGDLPRLAALAAASAARCLALRGPAADPTAALAARLGALGWAIAHTGSARGLIFAPGRVPAEGAATLRAAGFHGVIRFRIGGQA